MKCTEAESRMVVARDWGRREKGELVFNGDRVSVLQEGKEFWRPMVVMATQRWNVLMAPELVHLKMVKMRHFVMYALPSSKSFGKKE